MGRALAGLGLLALLALTGCAGLPEQGFATRYFGTYGGLLRDTFEPATDFAGAPLDSAVPVPAKRPAGRMTCEASARARANDVATEGYDEALQKTVYDRALADCRAWVGRF